MSAENKKLFLIVVVNTLFYKLKILIKTIIQTFFFKNNLMVFQTLKKLFDRFTERVSPLDIYHFCIIFVSFTQRKPWPSGRNVFRSARPHGFDPQVISEILSRRYVWSLVYADH